LIEEVPPEWGYSSVEKEKRRLRDLLNAVTRLRSGGFGGAGVNGAYHTRGWRR
jgi:CRISPR/Cas system-associated protein Cas7 (RAMP superfamily)